ncbi:caspase a-like [Xenentodon cancila]
MEKPVKVQMLEMLQDLGKKELDLFKWYLEDPDLLDGFSAIKKCYLETAGRTDTVDLMVDKYTTPTNAMEVMKLILKKMKTNDGQLGAASMKEQACSSELIPKIYSVTEQSVSNRVALIINNMQFNHLLSWRSGAEQDEEAMQKLLTDLGYEVLTFRDLSAEEIDKALSEFSKHPKLPHTDSVFVVVMSHGDMGVFYGSDSETYQIDQLYQRSSSKYCPALLNKPKIILIQTCSGDTMSYRSIGRGCFFIQYTVEVFNVSSHQDDIEELFRKVMQRFEVSLPSGKMQMPTKDRCSLVKKFYFFPDQDLQLSAGQFPAKLEYEATGI